MRTINPDLVNFAGLQMLEITRIVQSEEGRSVSEKGAPPVAFNRDPADTSAWDAEIEAAALDGSPIIDPNWIRAIISVESSGRPGVVSWAGACGLMQLLPTTAKKSCEELKDPIVNIQAGTAHFKSLLRDTCPGENREHPCKWGMACEEGNYDYALAAYNGGRGANWCSRETECMGQTWGECTKNQGYHETRVYVKRVRIIYDKL